MIRGGGRVLDVALSDAARAFEEARARPSSRPVKSENGQELRKGVGFREYSLKFKFKFKSTVRQCNTAPGRRWERSGACARAAPMVQGVGRVWRLRRRRASSARGPSPTSFWRFGLDKGTSIDFGQATRAAGAAAARVVEGVSAVRATHPVLYLTHARAFATYRCGVDGGARGRRTAGAAEREGACKVCHAGRRRRGRLRQRGCTSARGRQRLATAGANDLRLAADEASAS